eukprot:SAG31_NODE_2674_length_5267_cov_13.467492_3_plen_60_part_00
MTETENCAVEQTSQAETIAKEGELERAIAQMEKEAAEVAEAVRLRQIQRSSSEPFAALR